MPINLEETEEERLARLLRESLPDTLPSEPNVPVVVEPPRTYGRPQPIIPRYSVPEPIQRQTYSPASRAIATQEYFDAVRSGKMNPSKAAATFFPKIFAGWGQPEEPTAYQRAQMERWTTPEEEKFTIVRDDSGNVWRVLPSGAKPPEKMFGTKPPAPPTPKDRELTYKVAVPGGGEINVRESIGPRPVPTPAAPVAPAVPNAPVVAPAPAPVIAPAQAAPMTTPALEPVKSIRERKLERANLLRSVHPDWSKPQIIEQVNKEIR